MGRYIDIDVAENYLLEGYSLEETYNMIPADVVKVSHGEWKKEHSLFSLGGIDYYSCSICGFEEQIRTNYCPMCGAKMDRKAFNS